MKNYKHSLCAVLALVMVGSLVKVQGLQLIDSNKARAQKINAVAAQKEIVITEREVDDTLVGAAFVSNEEEQRSVEEKIEETVQAKETYRFGYVNITSGTLALRDGASSDATPTAQLGVVEQVEIIAEDGDYYKVETAQGDGYVAKKFITEDKEEAEYSAMCYANYKEAAVSVSSVNIRKLPTTDSGIIKGLAKDEKVVVLWGEGDFIRVAYGEEYDEGYVINTSIEFTGEWVSKEDFAAVQKRVADERAAAEAAAAAAEAAREQAAREAAAREEAQNAQETTSNAQATAQPSKKSTSKQTTSSQPVATSASSKGQAIVNTAMQYLGVPYVWGGTSPRGFDCSGLVQYVCRANGISVNRVAADQRKNGSYVKRENLQPGDLVFFARGGGRIHHVGIYVGNGNMIHAPQTGDVVKISSIETSYRRQTYAGAVRLY